MLTWIESENGPRPPVTAGILWRHRQPRRSLRRDVVSISGYREAVALHFRQILPASLTFSLIICFGEPFHIGLGRTPPTQPVSPSFVAGMTTVPVVVDSFGSASCITIHLTPIGARTLVNCPMKEFAGRMAAFDDVLGCAGAALRERLGNEPDWERRFDLVEAFLADRLNLSQRYASPTAWAFERLLQTGGAERVEAIAEKLGWSRKHLAARFHDEIGLAPKIVARVARFNRAIARARRSGAVSWADLAIDSGYFDQSHMVRDFKTFVGESPAVWHARLSKGRLSAATT
jgi:AraC-like DNA-binding protein